MRPNDSAARPATPGHEEPSWARPSTTLSAEPVHVATIHFRSKEWAIDGSDDAVLKALASAYAPYAGRNIHRPQEAQGQRSRIVGYVDPSEPDKQTLSVRRAVWTGDHLLRHLVRESGVIPAASTSASSRRTSGTGTPSAGTSSTPTSSPDTRERAGRRIGYKKPPRWDSRGAEFAEPTGRGGMTARQKLIHKARLLKRDVVETQMWAEIHYHGGRGSFALLYEESKKARPDQAKIESYIVNLEYLRFMLDETAGEANEILRMTE